jgi:hypothetical protein
MPPPLPHKSTYLQVPNGDLKSHLGTALRSRYAHVPFNRHIMYPESHKAVRLLRSAGLVIDCTEAWKTNMRYRSFLPARPSSSAPNSPNRRHTPFAERNPQSTLGTAVN